MLEFLYHFLGMCMYECNTSHINVFHVSIVVLILFLIFNALQTLKTNKTKK